MFILPRFSRSPGKPDTVSANDISRQLAWLSEQAKIKGYQDVDELAAKDMAEFVRLATQWREQQSVHTMPTLFERLKATINTLLSSLSQAMRVLIFGRVSHSGAKLKRLAA